MPDDGMKRAYRVARELLWDRLDDTSPGTTEILKQVQYEPQSLENQVMVIYAGTRGYCDNVPVDRMKAWEAAFLRFMETSNPEIGRDIGEKKVISEETEARLKEAIKAFNAGWQG